MGSFVKVARLGNAFQAHLVAGRLEGLGIPAVAVDDHVEGVPAGTVLWVPEADAERARRLIEADDAEEPEGTPCATAFSEHAPAASRPAKREPAPCPSCGSRDVDLVPRLLPFLPRRRRCLRCRTALP
jgi:hypothetical protein